MKKVDLHPEKVAFIHDDNAVTYKEFHDEINKAANILRRLGVGPHDKVGILMRNCLEWIYFYFGIQKNGAIVIPINTFYREKELTYILNDSEAKVVIATEEYQELLQNVKRDAKFLKSTIIIGDDVKEGMLNLKLIKKEIREKDSNFDNLAKPWYDAIYFYTSGTTGKPKRCYPYTLQLPCKYCTNK